MDQNSVGLKKLIDQGLVWVGKPGLETSTREDSSVKASGCYLRDDDELSSYPELPFGQLHEFALENALSSKEKNTWFPPLFFIAEILKQNLLKKDYYVAWIGKSIWPTPSFLEAICQTIKNRAPQDSRHDWLWEERCLFVNPPHQDKRLWAITQVLRTSSNFIVIADGSRFNLVATRRLQLAIKKTNALALILRPPWELAMLSTAHSRWLLSSQIQDQQPSCSVTLLRYRGIKTPQTWSLD